MLGQSLREAVRNHPVARAELQSVWNPQNDTQREPGIDRRRRRIRTPRPVPY